MTLEELILQNLLKRKLPAPVTSIAKSVRHPQKSTVRSILVRLVKQQVVDVSLRKGMKVYALKD